MSSRNPAYDSSESRRSPRSRSPGRYNEFRDEYRSGSARGTERRRSISDSTSRPNFVSSRDSFREPANRESSRDFPSRDPPRGPKALIDGAPSGPRAGSYGGDFRGDFGYRGDFRGSRGRPRGRGGWRDDSRDRGREAERGYRSPRDERAAPFRDERGRDRDRWERNDNFRGRRPTSPPGRGRSPSYSSRETTRDAPPSQDVDRLARRDSRDGPLSAASPSSDAPSAFRSTYSRGRGARGRGRGTYYDDFHGRNTSPDPSWTRRTQPSATPPPQVPAFGSASTSLSLPPSNLKLPVPQASTPPTGPANSSTIGVPVPTAPRSHSSKFIRDVNKATPNKWTIPDSADLRRPFSEAAKPGFTTAKSGTTSPSGATKSFETSLPRPNDNKGGPIPDQKNSEGRSLDKAPGSESVPGLVPPPQILNRKRRLICGKRTTTIPSIDSVETLGNGSDDSDADSVDSISRAEFLEGDLKQAEEEWSNIPIPLEEDDAPLPDELLELYDVVENEHEGDEEREERLAFIKELKKEIYAEKLIALHPLRPAADLNAVLLAPHMESSMNDPQSILFKVRRAASKPFDKEECVPVEGAEEDFGMDEGRSPKTEDQELPGSDIMSKPFTSGKEIVSRLEAHVSDLEPQLAYEALVSPADELQSLSSSRNSVKANDSFLPGSKIISNGRPARFRPKIDQFEKSEDELSGTEGEEVYAAVRKMMQTPPRSSLPNFNCKRWDQDSDFLNSLDPDPVVDASIRKSRAEAQARRDREQQEERQLWKQRYYQYRRWTDFSDDPVAVRSREKFAKSRAKAAADAAAVTTLPPALGSKPEPQRRTGSRFATEHDLERILQESKQEAKETEDKEREKEREERAARAQNASAKEAAIPDMYWDEEERVEHCFIDRTHIIPFERSFARLEFGEPIDNFAEEECEIFEKVYLETPKQWGKIAEALSQRDYKACIQHYYLVKHRSNLKDKFKKQGRKKGRRAAVPKGAKPKSNALTVDIVKGDETEDGQDTENGSERRRPRRAAAPTFAFEATPGDSEAQSSASTPGRRTITAPKGDGLSDAAPRRKTKVSREKGPKQSKNGQLLAAAPSPGNRQGESPGAQPVSSRLEAIGQNRFPLQYDGTAAVVPNFIPSPYVQGDKPNPSMTVEFDTMPQSFTGQDRLDSSAPTSFDSQDRRNPQQTSSYWSVPEQTDFPALLRHFGTDWHGIAKFMTSKTHIMVKNYYLRQVDSGRMSSWKEIAEDADEKRKRGEPTGPLPKQTVIQKRRIEGTTGSVQRPGSAMEGVDDISPAGQAVVLQQGSPTQPSLSSRFPALAQAGPVPQNLSSPATPASVLSRHLPPQTVQPASQQLQQPPRPSRGPVLGYFNSEPQRPILQAANTQSQSAPPTSDSISQRSHMVAQEAQLEHQKALRLEREQAAQAQALLQQAMQRERQLQMKQETDMLNVHQYEQYSNPITQSNAAAISRPDGSSTVPTSELRRTAPGQQYQSRVRSIVNEIPVGPRELKSSPSPAVPRPPLSAPPASQEQYAAPPPPAPPRQEPARKSNIMSLLNDEPSDRTPPPKRVSDVVSTSLQRSQTPPPQHTLQTSRYASHPPPATSQPPSQISQQMPSQLTSQHPPPQSQYSYSQPSGYPTHQHTSSTGSSRSYTPNNFESRAYPPPPTMPQQQSVYSQASRQTLGSHHPRREASLGDHHSATSGYSHGSAPSQPSMRMQESSYSAAPSPAQQSARQQGASPLDHAQSSDRDYYSRQSYQAPQQSSTAGSPPLGATYHAQTQQPPSHRQMAFGGTSHMASPPTQYATHHPLHRSRRNSFEGRYPPAVSSPPGPLQPGYTQAPQHQVTPLTSQYQQQHSGQDRFESSYERERRMQEDRRIQDEAYHQRRLDESRR